jgi:hypothetical protein
MALAAPLFYARPLAKAAISRPISAADGGGLRWRDGGRIAQFSEAGMSDNSLAAPPRAAFCAARAGSPSRLGFGLSSSAIRAAAALLRERRGRAASEE